MNERKTFDEALRALKRGKKIKREGWNGKKQFIEKGTVDKYWVVDGFPKLIDPCDVIVFHGTQGIQVGWLASQADMLTNDWIIME